MKSTLRIFFFLTSFCFPAAFTAQNEDYHIPSDVSDTLYHVQKLDGTGFIGEILVDNDEEVVIKTKELGKVKIPKYLIEKVEPIDLNNVRFSKGKLVSDDFAPRYFYTNSSQSLKKEQGSLLWNWWGVEMQYGVSDKFDVGLTTTWLGTPVGLNTKYSFDIAPDVTAALGSRVYSGGWAFISSGVVYPFGSITVGDKHTHLTGHAGFITAYGPQSSGERAWVFGLAGKAAITAKVDAVVEIFSLPVINTFDPVYLILPAIRINNDYQKAFQIGFAGLVSGNEALPIPVPFFQVMRSF